MTTSKAIRAFWWSAKNNFGDMLTPPIIEHLTGARPTQAKRDERGKLLAVGSIIHVIQPKDVVWGSGTKTEEKITVPTGAKILALRGPLTRERLISAEPIPEVYGDPALLIPAIYKPQQRKRYKLGIIPHYVDKDVAPDPGPDGITIDIQGHWKEIIKQVTACERIASSSLHGIIIAEAYGIPATWLVLGDKIAGGELKFQDYFLGTDRERQRPGDAHDPAAALPPIPDLEKIQGRLLDAFIAHLEKGA
jgi:pyruvyltransferase